MSNLQVYIRHPDDIPIEVHPLSRSLSLSPSTQQLGLICRSQSSIDAGSAISLRVPFVEPSIKVAGVVHWCRTNGDEFELGIDFDDEDAIMRMRMLEQLCQIHQYRKEVGQHQGRFLSPDDAALEWIELYAAKFPLNHV